jgi:hypothetical protein
MVAGSSLSNSRVLKEETQHLVGGVGAVRVGIGASGASARPGVSRAVNQPHLVSNPACMIEILRVSVAVAASYPATAAFRAETRAAA